MKLRSETCKKPTCLKIHHPLTFSPGCFITSSWVLKELGGVADLCLALQPQTRFRHHLWGARLGVGCLRCVSECCLHPEGQVLFLQPAISFLQTAPLSGHRLWPRNSNSLKMCKGIWHRGLSLLFFFPPNINGGKRRRDRMVFSFFSLLLRSYIS